MTGYTRGNGRLAIFASAVIAGATLATSAFAGGFAIREQSASGLGSAFAGVAAGGDLSSIYWNSAAVSVTGDGLRSNSNYSVILPTTDLTGDAFPVATGPGALDPISDPPFPSSVDIGRVAIVPASYYAYRMSDQLAVGMGINSPFGLVTKPDNTNWQGQTFGRRSSIFNVNLNPVVSYNILPSLAIGVGAQVSYIDVTLKSSTGVAFPTPAASATVNGDDIGFGYTAGVLFTPGPSTKVGVGFRSSINHELKGTLRVDGVPVEDSITANLKTPEIVTVSIRQKVTDNVTLLGTYEWTNWSRLRELRVVKTNSPPNLPIPGPVEAFNWEDSWMVSGGIEAQVMPRLTLRGGVAYEETPVPDSTRGVRLPDSNRIWVSAGATYKWSEHTTIDLAYSHLFFKDASIDLTQGGADFTIGTADDVRLVADVDTSIDIVAVGIRTDLSAVLSSLFGR